MKPHWIKLAAGIDCRGNSYRLYQCACSTQANLNIGQHSQANS